MHDGFLNADVARIIEITQRQVVAWSDKGLVRPATEARGSGTRRVYSYENLLEFGLVKILFCLGLGLHEVRRIMDCRVFSQVRLSGTLNLDFDVLFIGPEIEKCVPKISFLGGNPRLGRRVLTRLEQQGAGVIVDLSHIKSRIDSRI